MGISKCFQVELEYESTNDDIRRTALVLTPKPGKPHSHPLGLTEFAYSTGPVRLYEIAHSNPGPPRTSIHLPDSNLTTQSNLIESAHLWRTSYDAHSNL